MFSKRKKLFYFISVIFVLAILEGIGFILMQVYSLSPDYENMRSYNKIRKLLLGKQTPSELPRFTGQAYLGYIMTPGFEENNVTNVNLSGYRGPEVPLFKDTSTLRILFLGGSTTYSMAVAENEKTFPAVCGNILSKYLDTDHLKYKKVEVINGGLLWATSFELLTHYLFKFRYYQADIVVVHEGGNDAQAYIFNKELYSPDYSHWRKSMDNIVPLTQPACALLHSRLLSFFIIRLFYSQTEKNLFVHYQPELAQQWFKKGNSFNPMLRPNNAFRNNLTTLCREVVADKSRLVLVPFIYNSGHAYNLTNGDYVQGILNHNLWMQEIADSNKATFVELENKDITKQEYWVDDCHLNEYGEREKGKIVARGVLRCLQK